MIANPLMLDYASKEEQGKGAGINIMGIDAGIIFGLGGLLIFLRPFTFEMKYICLAAPIIILAMLTPFMIIEPPDVIKKKRRRSSVKRYTRLSKCGKVKQ